MADVNILFACTTLATDEIYEALFKDIDVDVYQDSPDLIWMDDLSSLVSHNDPDAIKSGILGDSENLEVVFSFRGSMKGYINSMKIVLNWLKLTDADTVLAHNFEFILFSRIGGRLVRNSHPVAAIPSEVLDIIDIPYEEEDLGFT